MPAFYILIFIAAILLWFCSSSWFKVFGDFAYKLWSDVKHAIAGENNNKNEKEQV